MNLATDTVILHLTNDQGYYEESLDIVKRCGDKYDACIELKDMVEAIMFPEGPPQDSDHFFRLDVMLETLSQVNWRQVYERLADDLDIGFVETLEPTPYTPPQPQGL